MLQPNQDSKSSPKKRKRVVRWGGNEERVTEKNDSTEETKKHAK